MCLQTRCCFLTASLIPDKIHFGQRTMGSHIQGTGLSFHLFHSLGWLLCEDLKASGNGILFTVDMQNLLIMGPLSEGLVFTITLGMT